MTAAIAVPLCRRAPTSPGDTTRTGIAPFSGTTTWSRCTTAVTVLE